MSTIEKKGIVVSNENGNARIMFQKDTACGSCSKCEGCEIKPTFFNAKNQFGLKAGDQVLLETKSSDVYKSIGKMYLIPVIFMVVGAFIPQILFKNSNIDMNLITLIFILAFLGLGLIIINRLDKKVDTGEMINIRKVEDDNQ